MKKRVISTTYILFLSLLVISFSCKKDKIEKKTETSYTTEKEYVINDVSYGTDPKQSMDIYLPKDRSKQNTKVIVLIHGGGWNAGDKSDYTSAFNSFKDAFKEHAIININYRLGTFNSPGYPKQMNDIEAALEEIKKDKYDVSNQFLLFGHSAGGHLALLYAYAFDENKEIKAVCNTVGPTDLTDTSYINSAEYQANPYIFVNLVGLYTYQNNPEKFEEVSPSFYVHQNCPPTISFYGDSDPLVPATQMNLLHDKLDALGVINEKTMYIGEGHGDWNTVNSIDYLTKIYSFINNNFN